MAVIFIGRLADHRTRRRMPVHLELPDGYHRQHLGGYVHEGVLMNCYPCRFAWCVLVLTLAAVSLAGCWSSSSPPAVVTQVAAAPPPPPPPGDDEAETAAAAPQADEIAPAEPPPQETPAIEPPAAAPQDDVAQAAGDQVVDPPPAQDVRPVAQVGQQAAGGNLAHPFPQRVPIPEFSENITWLNSQPLTKQDLKGKFVLLDFWTYCCINCIHILPELKKLEQQFPNNLVVIGVHSAKFETEKGTENIRQAILRYEIEHPVINDADHSMWWQYGINSWPTIALIDPEGNFVGKHSGEFKAPGVAQRITDALPYYRQNNLLDEKPLQFALEAHKEEPTPLRYPGKILADEKGNRLFISDSNHNRIVVTSLDGQLLDTIGSGAIGAGDGDFQTATFNHPQGCALTGDTLYVADTENHLLRKVDLKAKTVTTIAGTGEQASNPFPGWEGVPPPGVRPLRKWVGPPRTTALNSPWALWVHKTDLFIAMAGCHQIWKMPLDESEIGPYAGNGRENIVNGTLMPKAPFMGGGASSFAQPSGLAGDGTWLYVADSEGSSIRKVPLNKGTLEVDTVVGSDHLPDGTRLFAFGDKDGSKKDARLQHCLEVVHADNKLYVADTYNHKIKVVNKQTGETRTLSGTGKPGTSDEEPQFNEPAGLAYAKGKLYVADTNNHLIRTIDLASGKVATLAITGLESPGKQAIAGADVNR
jgi:DNA-binding beta-propeller fold protein YncE